MSKVRPCERCGTAPKEPGAGKRYCQPCREISKMSAIQRGREAAKLSREAIAREQPKVSTIQRRKDAPPGTTWCPRCCQYLKLSQFPKATDRKSGIKTHCRDCYSNILHEHWVKRRFDLTADEYSTLLERQGGVCAICKTEPKRKRLAVDHDHKTMRVRGLLCTMCNHKVLGGAKDDVEILRSAVAYLDQPPAFEVVEKYATGKK